MLLEESDCLSLLPLSALYASPLGKGHTDLSSILSYGKCSAFSFNECISLEHTFSKQHFGKSQLNIIGQELSQKG